MTLWWPNTIVTSRRRNKTSLIDYNSKQHLEYPLKLQYFNTRPSQEGYSTDNNNINCRIKERENLQQHQGDTSICHWKFPTIINNWNIFNIFSTGTSSSTILSLHLWSSSSAVSRPLIFDRDVTTSCCYHLNEETSPMNINIIKIHWTKNIYWCIMQSTMEENTFHSTRSS